MKKSIAITILSFLCLVFLALWLSTWGLMRHLNDRLEISRFQLSLEKSKWQREKIERVWWCGGLDQWHGSGSDKMPTVTNMEWARFGCHDLQLELWDFDGSIKAKEGKSK